MEKLISLCMLLLALNCFLVQIKLHQFEQKMKDATHTVFVKAAKATKNNLNSEDNKNVADYGWYMDK